MNGRSKERRERQAELIRGWQPWAKSTGSKSDEGKERVSRNAWRGGHRERLRELSKVVNAEIRQAQSLVDSLPCRRTAQLPDKK